MQQAEVPQVAAVRVCGIGDLPDGEAITVAAGDAGLLAAGVTDAVSVFADGGAFFALDDTCSHAQASLGEGFVEDGCVECPLHGALFRLSDGQPLSLPATQPVRAHRVEVRDGAVWLHPGQAPLPV